MPKLSLPSLQSKLLDAARGITPSKRRQRALRYYPLESHQIRCIPGESPSQFHEKVCEKIRMAQDRVYLASLYIGPAADPDASPKEVELLEALASTKASSLKILLDQNRALRAVPTKEGSISSAESCRKVTSSRLRRREGTNPAVLDCLRLHSVLSPLYQMILPNPYNEVAGVFHIKCYIFDNELVLTGANLSEEYFTDRTDRYLWITGRSNDNSKREGEISPACFVKFYVDLVETLCDHSIPYPASDDDVKDQANGSMIKNMELFSRLRDLLTVDDSSANYQVSDTTDIAAYAVPTLQAPHLELGDIPTDEEVMTDLVTAASGSDIRLAAAYLNPTENMLRALAGAQRTDILTAGHISHGFKPKRNATKPSLRTLLIPRMFDTLARNRMTRGTNMYLWYYQRFGWTFHAKGLWISAPRADPSGGMSLSGDSTLQAVAHGSGNYGYRSAKRDMESNVILVLPEDSPLQSAFRDEWNAYGAYVRPATGEEFVPLPSPLRWVLPFVRPFL